MNWSRRRLLAGLGASPLLACTHAGRMPQVAPDAIETRLPLVTRQQVDNGPWFYTSTDASVPLVSIALSVAGGFVHDPPGLEGRAMISASLLTEGMEGGTAQQLLERYGDLGATPWAVALSHRTVLGCTVRRDQAAQAMRILADNLRTPTMATASVDKLVRERRAWFDSTMGEPAMLANLAQLRGVLGAWPATTALPSGSPQSVAALTAPLLAEHREASVARNQLDVLVTGDATEDEAIAWASDAIADWPTVDTPRPSFDAITPPPRASATLTVPVHDVPQAFMAVGSARGRVTDRFTVAEQMASSFVSSLIHQQLRGEMRETYAVRSRMWSTRMGGVHTIWSGVAERSLAKAVGAVARMLDRLRGSGVLPPEAVASTQQHMQLAAMNSIQGSEAGLRGLVELSNRGARADYASQQMTAIEQVDLDSIERALDREFAPDRLCFTLVGHPDRLKAAVRTLGTNEANTVNVEPTALLGLTS